MPHQQPPDVVDRAAAPVGGSAADTAEDSRSFRPLIIGLAAIGIPVIALVVFLQLFVAQRIPELTDARLESAEQLWTQRGPASYDMDLELRGAQPGMIHIEVRDGEPTAVTRNGRPPSPHTWNTWSVPGMFETLERELVLAEDPEHEMKAAAGAQLRLRCDFDPQLGYPRRYHRHATGGAPEVFWQVTKFVAR